MNIEYEAAFRNVNKDEVRQRLHDAGAELIRPEFSQRRYIFAPPGTENIVEGWIRVRDEGDKITLSYKVVDGTAIENQKETCLVVDDFDTAVSLLIQIGCRQKAYQETKRELWQLDGADITIDEWPFLEPFVEVEARDETTVRSVSEKIGFDYSTAYFGAVDGLYAEKYKTTKHIINNATPRIVFDMENPFV